MVEDVTNLQQLSEEIEQLASENGLWSRGDTVVAAVSGGPDSMALLLTLHHISTVLTPLKLVCAHVHHGFRQESDQEAQLVEALCARLAIPFEMAVVDVPAYIRESGRNAQDAARSKRYAFLFEIAGKYRARSIALAHHGDDQAETVLMRLLRGSGPSGLSGMKLIRLQDGIQLIRPFLRRSKADLVAICRQSGVDYAVDDSNEQTKYRRNAVRLQVLPFLEEYNPRISSSLVQTAEIIGSEDDYMESAAQEAYTALVQKGAYGPAMSAPSFLALHVALQRRLIKLILNYLSPDREISDFTKIELIRRRIAQDISNSWSLDLGEGICCIREYDTVSFMNGPPVCLNYIYELHSPQELELLLPEIQRRLKLELWDEARLESHPRMLNAEAFFDADHLHFPLIVRSRQPGDKMKLMGLNGSKKVKDILINEKIPPSARQAIPIVCDGLGTLIWIPGVRRSVHAAVGQHTTRILRLTLSDAGEA
ncbi:tRNA lysidine(34) synthetase TilS [Paenibacillus sp. F411]|uniref:tRNA lysidine(34) synthetase TilS n=1 Tax=Paenibacillus sp. F411 TaxID=2820239 RepID=UPI001AAFCE0A|nr:tRNA lysidine(34) synthetase TilS [Paenibacillus sp. F411]MBO2945960.1 tRNA lysidine(34) synthetase TilS [Paenibacillus sp. F411]